MRIVAISDTHGMHGQLTGYIPDCDVLIHSGDFCKYGSSNEVHDLLKWYCKQPAKVKIIVPGNHDRAILLHPEEIQQMLEFYDTRMLIDQELKLDEVKFYGAPWSCKFTGWWFNTYENEVFVKTNAIPDDTDVLITHGPPEGISDVVHGFHYGCSILRHRVDTIKPKVHIFGHIHEGAGVQERNGTKFINASCCNERYMMVNPAQVIDL